MRKEIEQQILKKKAYTLEEISNVLGVDIPTIRTWRDLGVFSSDKRQVHRLKSGEGKNIIHGKDLIDFLIKTHLMPGKVN